MENNGVIKLAEFINNQIDNIKYAEKISAAIFGVGISLQLLKVPKTNPIVIVGAVILALCYYLMAFQVPKATSETPDIQNNNAINSEAMIIFLNKLIHFSLSISVIAILFAVMNFNGSNAMFIVAGASLLFALPITLLSKAKIKSQFFDKFVYLKIIFFILILIILYYSKFIGGLA